MVARHNIQCPVRALKVLTIQGRVWTLRTCCQTQKGRSSCHRAVPGTGEYAERGTCSAS